MANVKITELTAATALAGTDVLPIVDVGADATKKVSVSDLLRNVPDGTASAPALAFADDQNTGLLSPAENQLAFATSGTQRLVIDGSGNVGIGGTATNYANHKSLALFGSGSTAAGLLQFTDASGNADAAIFADDGSLYINADYDNTTSDSSIRFRVDGSSAEKLRIDSSGKVLIGTTSAILNSSQALLQVSNSSGPLFVLGRNDTTVSNGNLIGDIKWYSNAGSANEEVARIRVDADADQGSGDKPGRIEFHTTADGASSPTERMRINSSGVVNIGTTAAADTDVKLQVAFTGGNSYIQIKSADSTGTSGIKFGRNSVANRAGIDWSASTDALQFRTGGTNERMRIDSSGRLLVGASSSADQNAKIQASTTGLEVFEGFNYTNTNVGAILRLAKSRATSIGSQTIVQDNDELGRIAFLGTDGSVYRNAAKIAAEVDSTPGGSDMPGRLVFATTPDGSSTPTERLRIASDGRATFANDVRMDGGTTSVPALLLTADNNAGKGLEIRNAGNSLNVEIGVDGSATFAGAVSKGSGSFRIDHPLKAETHQLVHSFVEGPQADNIYRGKVDLVAGTAAVNIDTVAGMTEGTFVALNREIQCFTTNETGWTAIKGSVTGNVLTITAQENTCTDTISWLVIGERQDQHMYDTNWTDENGKVIVEPEKPVAASEAE